MRLSATKKQSISLGLSLAFLGFCGVSVAGDDTQGDLDIIRREIEATSMQLDKAENSRTAIEEELTRNKSLADALVIQMQKLDVEMEHFRREITRLRAQRSSTQAALDIDRNFVLDQLKTSYSFGRQDYLKLLLNQEDPGAILRTMTYHTIIQRYRSEGLRALHAEVQRIVGEERAINQNIARQDELQKEKTAMRSVLKRYEEERQTLLASVSSEIKKTAAQLQRLKLDEEKLETLPYGLKGDLTDIPDANEEVESFANLKGALPWPTRGQVVHRFGTERGANGLIWQGVLIEAQNGSSVHAISRGRVAFAEPLKGFGLLLIVDHGDGYMSLYGHNERLFKEVGDWVSSGDRVAEVGMGNGDEYTGLYFEIRHNGKPRNPVKWCHGTSPLAADTLVKG